MLMVLPMLAYPALMVVPWQMRVGPDWRPDGLYVDAIVRLVTALAAATILGRFLARRFCPDADPKLDPLGRSTTRLIDLIVILSIPAIVVGWQASIAVTVIASLLAVGFNAWLRPPREAFGRFAISMPLALTFQLVFWRHLHAPTADRVGSDGSWYWPSDNGRPWVVLTWVVAVMLIPLWLRDEPPRQVSDAADTSPGSSSAETPPEEQEAHQEDDDGLTDQALAGRDRG
jgi:leader peptidase (prepilin peptidase)/N-methyltransferase